MKEYFDALPRKMRNLLKKGVLVIRPILDEEYQFTQTGIDLRLGNEFIVTKRTALTVLDPADRKSHTGATLTRSKIYLPFAAPFVVHPSQFILTTTLEFVSIPKTISAMIINRPELSKLGVAIPATQYLPPGHKGTIPLEITNLSNVPIMLYPGSRICKLSLIN